MTQTEAITTWPQPSRFLTYERLQLDPANRGRWDYVEKELEREWPDLTRAIILRYRIAWLCTVVGTIAAAGVVATAAGHFETMQSLVTYALGGTVALSLLANASAVGKQTSEDAFFILLQTAFVGGVLVLGGGALFGSLGAGIVIGLLGVLIFSGRYVRSGTRAPMHRVGKTSRPLGVLLLITMAALCSASLV